MSKNTTIVHLVRHGATEHNLLKPPRMQGRHIDEPLAVVGRRQAAAVATALARRPIAAVYASPLQRAMETAEAIAREHHHTVRAIEGLAEADVGVWEDRSWDEIEQNDREAYEAFRRDPVAHGYPGGESLDVVVHRVAAAIDKVVAQHPGDEIVVVAHSVVNRLYLGELIDVPIALRRRLPQDNCGVSTIACYEEKRRVRTINAVDHLES